MDVNEHEGLSNITPKHKLIYIYIYTSVMQFTNN